MDFQLSEDQQAIADLAESLFVELCADDKQVAFDGSDEPYMVDLWAQCVETGLHALAIPEQAGGSELGMTELMLVLEAQGRSLAQVPLWRHQLAAAAVAQFGGAAGAEQAAAAAEGRLMMTLAIDNCFSAHGVSLRVHASGEQGLLTGKVEAVPLGAEAGHALLAAETEAGVRLVSVSLEQAGVTRTAGVFTHGEAVADLHFVDCPLDQSAVLPESALPWLEQRAVAALGALQLGVSTEQVRRTVEYINERRQFDRAIASFQAVQMTMADAQIAIEALRSTLWQLVYRLDAGLPSPAEALAVKYLASECGHHVAHKTQHVHGGIGVDLTYPIHRYLYWSRALGMALGGSAVTLERLGDWLADNDKLGWKYDLEEQQAL